MDEDGITVDTPRARFFYVPLERFVMLSLLTLGVYETYWMYKNWKYIKDRDGTGIQPFWRAIFGVFFIHSLLKAIRTDPEVNEIVPADFSATSLAVGWLVVIVGGNLLGRVDETWIALLGLAVSIPSFLFFVPVQKYINRVNETLCPRPVFHGWSTGHVVSLIGGAANWLIVWLAFFMD